MDAINTEKTLPSSSRVRGFAVAAVLLMWCSQPPLMIWPLALVALVPWLQIACFARRLQRRDYLIIWLVGFIYWAVTLQGLRHAHAVMYACWIALAGYLAVYFPAFVMILRQMLSRRVPIWIAVPVAWVGLECIRNYLLTGISAVMLGHALADVPMMIQVADLVGSYGVSLVVASVNVAAFGLLILLQSRWGNGTTIAAGGALDDDGSWQITVDPSKSFPCLVGSVISASLLLAVTLVYGYVRLSEPSGEPLATFALIQRNEHVEYMQDQSRELQIFQNYARQTIASINGSDRDIDAVVWPESMFSGGLPWMMADADAKPPAASQLAADEFQQLVSQNQEYFVRRARDIQTAIVKSRPARGACDLIVGCGVIRYRQSPQVFSGVVHVKPPDRSGEPVDWYGKTHLVMFGEYVPLVSNLPGIREYIKSMGLGLTTGPGAKRFLVDGTSVSPNLCIETAVERVAVNQLASLDHRGEMADVVITVTNDGWFDDSSVIDHHLRCAQLVAVGCRRPVLSAANNGPTAWIDSRGQIVRRLPTGTDGAVIATPRREDRISLYLRIGDWPARFVGLLCIAFCADAIWQRRKEKQNV